MMGLDLEDPLNLAIFGVRSYVSKISLFNLKTIKLLTSRDLTAQISHVFNSSSWPGIKIDKFNERALVIYLYRKNSTTHSLTHISFR